MKGLQPITKKDFQMGVKNNLSDVAGKTRTLPLKFYNKNACNVNNLFNEYAKPLIGKR